MSAPIALSRTTVRAVWAAMTVAHVRGEPQPTLRALAKRLNTVPSVIHTAMCQLEALGYISRTPHAGRGRVVLVPLLPPQTPHPPRDDAAAG